VCGSHLLRMQASNKSHVALRQGLVMYINTSMREEARASKAAAAGGTDGTPSEDAADAAAAGAQNREHLTAALGALQHAVEGHPRLAMLMASRPALAPLLDVLKRACRCGFLLLRWIAHDAELLNRGDNAQCCRQGAPRAGATAGRFRARPPVRIPLKRHQALFCTAAGSTVWKQKRVPRKSRWRC